MLRVSFFVECLFVDIHCKNLWRGYQCPDLSIIFRLHFPAFEANKLYRFLAPGWSVVCEMPRGRSLKIHLCGLEIYLCVGKYTSAVGICTKTTFPHFPFCRPGKGQHTEHRGRLWPTKVLQSHFSFSLLNSMNMTNKNQRRPKKTTWWVTSSSRKQWNNLKRNFIFFFYCSILGTFSPVKNTKKMKMGIGMTAHGFDKISTFSRFLDTGVSYVRLA